MNLLIAWEEMREAIWEVRKFDRGQSGDGGMERAHLQRRRPSAWLSVVPMVLEQFLQRIVWGWLGESGEVFYLSISFLVLDTEQDVGKASSFLSIEPSLGDDSYIRIRDSWSMFLVLIPLPSTSSGRYGVKCRGDEPPTINQVTRPTKRGQTKPIAAEADGDTGLVLGICIGSQVIGRVQTPARPPS